MRSFCLELLIIGVLFLHYAERDNEHSINRDLYYFFLLNLFVITRLKADGIFFLRDLYFICIFIDAI